MYFIFHFFRVHTHKILYKLMYYFLLYKLIYHKIYTYIYITSVCIYFFLTS